jgi:hypothetical protein
MTEIQEKQIMTMLTRCLNGIKRLEEGQTRLESDHAELILGQRKLEKELQLTNKALSVLAEDSMKTRVKVGLLEDKIELSN